MQIHRDPGYRLFETTTPLGNVRTKIDEARVYLKRQGPALLGQLFLIIIAGCNERDEGGLE